MPFRLRRLKGAAGQMRVEGVERDLYLLWRRQLAAAHAAVAAELDARPTREPVDAGEVRRAVRLAMNAADALEVRFRKSER